MSKKYELLKHVESSALLYRVKALRDFNYVKKGQLGGLVSGEHNLSHGGHCWIGKGAAVVDNARVQGNAQILDQAIVSESAVVEGNALVANYARVGGSARVYGDSFVVDNASVQDNVKIYGNAEIVQSAKVSGNAEVYGEYGETEVGGSAELQGDMVATGDVLTCTFLRDTITVSDNHVAIGCQVHTFDYWRDHIERIGRKYAYTEQEIKLYKGVVFAMIEAKVLERGGR